MKILLAQKLPYARSFTGASKANRMLMAELARRGHTCRAIAFTSSPPSSELVEETESARVFSTDGVEVHAVSRAESFERYLLELIARLAPDVILVSEDRSYLSLVAALESEVPVVFVCHSQSTLPFGPESFQDDTTKTDVLRRASAVVAPSRYVCDYIRRWGGLESNLLSFDTYGRGPFAELARFGEGSVVMINPSQIKGLSIFAEVARRMPDIPFAAVPTWATTAADRQKLSRLPNVQLIPPFENVDDLFRQTRVLLVPSLWGEAFPTSVIEAMLRGIPVLASNVGGLPEAKLGVDYVLPVRRIERYEAGVDEHKLPVPVVPYQEVEPWQEALRSMLSNREQYERVSRESRNAALRFVTSLDITPFEELLLELQQSSAAKPTERPGVPDPSPIDKLSLEKLELLGMLLERSPKRSE